MVHISGTLGALDDLDDALETTSYEAVLMRQIITGDEYAEVRFV